MGIWEMIKELFNAEAEGEKAEGGTGERGEKRRITFYGLKVEIEDMLKDNLSKKEWLRKTFIEKIDVLEGEMSEPLKKLKGYDLNKRKDHERLKLIVADNYYLYCANVDRLIREINKLRNLELTELMAGLSLKLKEFSKHSAKPYEKATILIGEEMANVRKIILGFVREMDRLEKENASFFEKNNWAERINEMIFEVEQNGKHCVEIDKAIEEINAEEERMSKSIDGKEKKIEEIKNSPEYRKEIEAAEENKNEAKGLENKLARIKERIDIKMLGNHFHFDEKKNELVKKYANNFKKALESDENLEIIEFVKSAQGIDIGELIEIKEKIKKSGDLLISESEKKIFAIEGDIEKIRLEIGYRKIKADGEMKKKDKLVGKKEEILKEINGYADRLLNAEIEMRD